MTVVEIG